MTASASPVQQCMRRSSREFQESLGDADREYSSCKISAQYNADIGPGDGGEARCRPCLWVNVDSQRNHAVELEYGLQGLQGSRLTANALMLCSPELSFLHGQTGCFQLAFCIHSIFTFFEWQKSANPFATSAGPSFSAKPSRARESRAPLVQP